MDFIEILRRALRSQFVGKLHIQLKSNRQFLGECWVDTGRITWARYANKEGVSALSSIYIDSRVKDNITFMEEREYIPKDQRNIFMDSGKIFERIFFHYRLYKKNIDLKPKNDLIFQTIYADDAQLSLAEKYMLSIMDQYQVVEEIYRNSDLLEWETTEALIGLRKKGHLKIIQKAKGNLHENAKV
jgi:hypothetical protein